MIFVCVNSQSLELILELVSNYQHLHDLNFCVHVNVQSFRHVQLYLRHVRMDSWLYLHLELRINLFSFGDLPSERNQMQVFQMVSTFSCSCYLVNLLGPAVEAVFPVGAEVLRRTYYWTTRVLALTLDRQARLVALAPCLRPPCSLFKMRQRLSHDELHEHVLDLALFKIWEPQQVAFIDLPWLC